MSVRNTVEFPCPDSDRHYEACSIVDVEDVAFESWDGMVVATSTVPCDSCGRKGHYKYIPIEDLLSEGDQHLTATVLVRALSNILDCDSTDIRVNELFDERKVEVTVPSDLWITPPELHIAVEECTDFLASVEIKIAGDEETDAEVPEPHEILRENADLAEEKDEDYGKSWKLAGETLAMWSEALDIEEIDAQSEGEMISNGLYYQRLIKLIRAFNLEYGSGDPHNEPIPESHDDGSNYGAIHSHHARAREANEE